MNSRYALSDLQDVSMRLIAEQMLPVASEPIAKSPVPSPLRGWRSKQFKMPSRNRAFKDQTSKGQMNSVGRTYMQDELTHVVTLKPIKLKPLSSGRLFHLYCRCVCMRTSLS